MFEEISFYVTFINLIFIRQFRSFSKSEVKINTALAFWFCDQPGILLVI